MLALARALVGRPSLLVVDEPTEGLSLQMVQLAGKPWRCCARLASRFCW